MMRLLVASAPQRYAEISEFFEDSWGSEADAKYFGRSCFFTFIMIYVYFFNQIDLK
jgi:hypothetical protein